MIASSSVVLPTDEQSIVLRLVGRRMPGENPPANLLRHTEAATQEVRRMFGNWLWNWVEASGVLHLVTLPGPVSWWWLSTLSEKSFMRSPLIRELYWLTLLRHVLTAQPVRRVRWIGDDRILAETAAGLVRRLGIECFLELTFRPRFSGLPRLCASRLKWTAEQVMIWVLLKIRPLGSRPVQMPATLLYSRFPILWEETSQGWRERMYGDWPDYLSVRGETVGYAAVYSGSLWQLFRRGDEFRIVCAKHGIQILETALSLGDLLKIHFTGRLWWRYWRWRQKIQPQNVLYGDINIGRLFWREMDRSALSVELLFNEAIITGFRKIMQAQGKPQAVFHPFEYQPMERAIAAAVRSSGAVPVVGLQTGLFTSNHLGFALSADELRLAPKETARAPVPDILAAYGEQSYAVYLERLGRDRVCLSGAVRYPRLGIGESFDATAFRRQHDLPEGAEFIFVATPAGWDEALPVLTAAFAFAAETPGVFLLIKFHYHLLLHHKVTQLAAEYGVSRYRIFAGDLYKLLRLAPVLLSGGSSTCIEALALGTMPVVYVSPGEMSFNPALEVPQAVFLWHTVQELRSALQSCLIKDAAYEARREAWPMAVAAHLFRLDGCANDRLYEFLRAQHVL